MLRLSADLNMSRNVFQNMFVFLAPYKIIHARYLKINATYLKIHVAHLKIHVTYINSANANTIDCNEPLHLGIVSIT